MKLKRTYLYIDDHEEKTQEEQPSEKYGLEEIGQLEIGLLLFCFSKKAFQLFHPHLLFFALDEGKDNRGNCSKR